MKESNAYIKTAPELLASFLIYTESILGKSEKTVHEYFYDLRVFYRFIILQFYPETANDLEFREIPIDKITLEDLRRVDVQLVYSYIHFLNRELNNSAGTRARKIAALKAYFKYLSVKTQKLQENPLAELDSVKVEKRLPKYFSLEDSVALLNAVKDRNSIRDYCILTLFLNCGMRLSELVNINITDIREDKLTVIGKGDKERVIYLNDSCRAALERYLEVRNQMVPTASDKNALFLSERNRRISRRTVQYTVEKYVKKLGLDPHKYTTHKLRHTAATLMYQSGVDIRLLQEILGHQQLSTTEIYTHVDSKQLRAAVEMNPLAHIKPNSSQ